MGNKSHVVRDNSVVAESLKWLEELTMEQHRGRGDTMEAARGRAAKEAGIPVTYASRLWHRAEHMRDVSGAVYRNLRIAYDRLVERQEAAAESYRQQRMAIQGNHETHHRGALAPEGMGASAPRAMVP